MCNMLQRAAGAVKAVQETLGNGLLRANRKLVCKPEKILRYQNQHMISMRRVGIDIPSRVAPQEFSSCPCKRIAGTRVFLFLFSAIITYTIYIFGGRNHETRTENPLQNLFGRE